jgi:hypothetical protein
MNLCFFGFLISYCHPVIGGRNGLHREEGRHPLSIRCGLFPDTIWRVGADMQELNILALMIEEHASYNFSPPQFVQGHTSKRALWNISLSFVFSIDRRYYIVRSFDVCSRTFRSQAVRSRPLYTTLVHDARSLQLHSFDRLIHYRSP